MIDENFKRELGKLAGVFLKTYFQKEIENIRENGLFGLDHKKVTPEEKELLKTVSSVFSGVAIEKSLEVIRTKQQLLAKDTKVIDLQTGLSAKVVEDKGDTLSLISTKMGVYEQDRNNLVFNIESKGVDLKVDNDFSVGR